MARNSKQNGNDSVKSDVRLHYLKSSDFRTIHVDGGIGGITPTGYIHLSLYSERLAIPREQVMEINKDGSPGKIVEEMSRGGVVREMQVDTLMNLNTAKAVKNWLDQQIGLIEKSYKDQK